MNIIFNNLDNFLKHENIQIDTEKLKFDNNVKIEGNDIIYYPTIIDNKMPAGCFQVTFDGSKLSSGIYYLKLSSFYTCL